MGILFYSLGRTTQKSHHEVFCQEYPAAELFDDTNAQRDDDDDSDADDVDDDDDNADADDDDQNPEKAAPMFIVHIHISLKKPCVKD